jgi:hypothetical protein
MTRQKLSFLSEPIRCSISRYSAALAHGALVFLPFGEFSMGHTRLGEVPKTQKWFDIVGHLVGRMQPGDAGSHAATIGAIASQTLDATEEGLNRATADPGVRYTFYLMTQVALASRTSDWESTLGRHGIQIGRNSTVFDLTAQLQDAIDRYVSRNPSGATDLSEIAQQSAGEAITSLTGPRTASLFANDTDVRDAVRPLSTKKGFGELGQRFFGTFITRFLNFYLSRATAAAIGGPRLRDLGDVAQFNRSLRAHCDQSARIVRDFCGEWYSKTEYQKGINLENTSGFLAVAFTKLRSELKQQKGQV